MLNIDMGKRIDTRIIEEHDKNNKERGHLGASLIGHNCYRYLWYVLHHALKEKFSAKQLRLFERGNLEEARFVGWLKLVCEEVMERDPRTNKQWRVALYDGVFSGSADCVIKIDGQWALAEFKTHGDKSFKELIKHKNVKYCKPVHYSQMQVYMRLLKLKCALYMAINKNTDEIYYEWVELDLLESDISIDKAGTVIECDDSSDMPKLSESPLWWECKMCHFAPLCHKGAKPNEHCRTCIHSRPAEGTTWRCNLHDTLMPFEEQLVRKDCWEPAEVFQSAYEKEVKVSLSLK